MKTLSTFFEFLVASFVNYCTYNAKIGFKFSKHSSAMEEDNSWVFDSLVAFLNGPIWNAPLQTFIEEKSLIFEPNVEHKEEYQKIFDEFKNLVDVMLGTFMEDIGITSEQFENACRESKRYRVAFDPNSFEQVWAANDYEMFKKMMTQRNVELQLQALELIEKKYGITPQSFVPKERSNEQEASITVEKASNLENFVMEEASKNFQTDADPEEIKVNKDNILEEKVMLNKVLEEAKQEPIKPEEKPPKIDEKPLESKQKEIDAIELKKRQEYLRAQRDKLVALKKEARRKQLDSSSSSKTKNRPKSAKAAEAVLTGNTPTIDNQLQIRKTLAERLRAEVVASKE